MFRGAMVAIVTPFKNDQVDEKALRELIEFQIANGTDAIVPCGSTGESATLTHEEHDRVIEITIDAVKKRVPVIAGTGSNNTAEALRLTMHAFDAGADGPVDHLRPRSVSAMPRMLSVSSTLRATPTMAPAIFHSWSRCAWSFVNCDDGSLGRFTSISKWRPPTVPYRSGSPATPIAVPWRLRTTMPGLVFSSPMIRATTAFSRTAWRLTDAPPARSTVGSLLARPVSR